MAVLMWLWVFVDVVVDCFVIEECDYFVCVWNLVCDVDDGVEVDCCFCCAYDCVWVESERDVIVSLVSDVVQGTFFVKDFGCEVCI